MNPTDPFEPRGFASVLDSHLGMAPTCRSSLLSSLDIPNQPPYSQFLGSYDNADPDLAYSSRVALASTAPTLCQEGVGGTYIIDDSNGTPISVFKPTDEEPGAKNDSKKAITVPILPPGGGHLREVAAYLLDQQMLPSARAGVPETTFLTYVRHPSFVGGSKAIKHGSVQRFIPNDGNSDSVSFSRFSTDDVHRIGVFDLRVFNLDRNAENMLVKGQGKKTRLVPIDHTYILPPKLHGAYFAWHHWPQAKVPFSTSMLKAIASIDIVADVKILRSLGIDNSSIRTLIASSLWLKVCAAAGLTLFQIASLSSAPLPNDCSFLEQLVQFVIPARYFDSSQISRLKLQFEAVVAIISQGFEQIG